jgi:hypothetical protein
VAGTCHTWHQWCWESPKPNGFPVYSAVALKPADVVLAGGGSTLLEFRDGAFVGTQPPDFAYTALGNVGGTLVAGGSGGFAMRDVAGTWQEMPSPGLFANPYRPENTPSSIFGSSLQDAWASSPGFLYSYEGGVWSQSKVLNPQGEGYFFGAGIDDMWHIVVGTDWTPYRLDRGSWTSVPVSGPVARPDGSLVTWRAGQHVYAGFNRNLQYTTRSSVMDCTRIDGCKAIPSLAQPFITFSGLTLAPNDIWASAEMAVPSLQTALIHSDGTQWNIVTQSYPAVVTGTASNDVWAFRSFADYSHWDGTSWTSSGTVPPELTDISAPADDDVWAIGAEVTYVVDLRFRANGARQVVQHFDGTNWTVFDSPIGTPKSIFARSATDVWVGGAEGLVHWNGNSWTTVLSSQDIVSIRGNATDLWIVSANSGSTVYHWDGQTVKSESIGVYSGAQDFYVGSKETYLATSTAVLHRSATTGWYPLGDVFSGPRPSLRFIPGSSDTDLWLASPTNLWHWDGTSWIEVKLRGQNDFWDCWVGASANSRLFCFTSPTADYVNTLSWQVREPMFFSSLTSGAGNAPFVQYKLWDLTGPGGELPLLIAPNGMRRAVRSPQGTIWLATTRGILTMRATPPTSLAIVAPSGARVTSLNYPLNDLYLTTDIPGTAPLSVTWSISEQAGASLIDVTSRSVTVRFSAPGVYHVTAKSASPSMSATVALTH